MDEKPAETPPDSVAAPSAATEPTATDATAELAAAPESPQQGAPVRKTAAARQRASKAAGVTKRATKAVAAQAAPAEKKVWDSKKLPKAHELRLARGGVRADDSDGANLVIEFANGYRVTLAPIVAEKQTETRDLIVEWARQRLGANR